MLDARKKKKLFAELVRKTRSGIRGVVKTKKVQFFVHKSEQDRDKIAERSGIRKLLKTIKTGGLREEGERRRGSANDGRDPQKTREKEIPLLRSRRGRLE